MGTSKNATGDIKVVEVVGADWSSQNGLLQSAESPAGLAPSDPNGRIIIYQSPEAPSSSVPIFMLAAFGMGLALGLLLLGAVYLRARLRRRRDDGRRSPLTEFKAPRRHFASFRRDSIGVAPVRPSVRRLPELESQRVRTATTAIDVAAFSATPIMRSTPAAFNGLPDGRLSPGSQLYPRVHTFSVIAQIERACGEFTDLDDEAAEAADIFEGHTGTRLFNRLQDMSLLQRSEEALATEKSGGSRLDVSTSCPNLRLEPPKRPHVKSIVSLFERHGS